MYTTIGSYCSFKCLSDFLILPPDDGPRYTRKYLEVDEIY